jgi:hypothetical protein
MSLKSITHKFAIALVAAVAVTTLSQLRGRPEVAGRKPKRRF